MMKVYVTIEIPMEDLLEYQKGYAECNGEEISVEEAKQYYIECFMADRADYIDTDRMKVCFV